MRNRAKSAAKPKGNQSTETSEQTDHVNVDRKSSTLSFGGERPDRTLRKRWFYFVGLDGMVSSDLPENSKVC